MARWADLAPEKQARLMEVIETSRADGFVSAHPLPLAGIARAASIWVAPDAFQAQIREASQSFPETFLVLARAEREADVSMWILCPVRRVEGQELYALIVFVSAAYYDDAEKGPNRLLTLIAREWNRVFQERR